MWKEWYKYIWLEWRLQMPLGKQCHDLTWLGILVCSAMIFMRFHSSTLRTLIIQCMLQESLPQIHNPWALFLTANCWFVVWHRRNMLSLTGYTEWKRDFLYFMRAKSKNILIFVSSEHSETCARLKCSFNSAWDASQAERQNIMRSCL